MLKLGDKYWIATTYWPKSYQKPRYQPREITVENIYIDGNGIQYDIEIENDYEDTYVTGIGEEDAFATELECQLNCDMHNKKQEEKENVESNSALS